MDDYFLMYFLFACVKQTNMNRKRPFGLYSSDKAEANVTFSQTGNPSRRFADSSGSSLYGHSIKYIRKSNSPQKGTQQRAPTIKTAKREKIEINSSNLSKMSVKYNFLYIFWTFPGRNKCMQLFCYSFKTSATMKMLLAVIVLLLLVEANAQSRNFFKQFARGQLLDLCDIYRCELSHNCIFLHWPRDFYRIFWHVASLQGYEGGQLEEVGQILSRQRKLRCCPKRKGGESGCCGDQVSVWVFASSHMVTMCCCSCTGFCDSNTWEGIQKLRGRHAEDSAADQIANRWGRNGGDPNVFRPKGLPAKY